jgi:hypothetical protein
MCLGLYGGDWSWYAHMLAGLLIFCNILGNFLGLWLTDTSTRYSTGYPLAILMGDTPSCYMIYREALFSSYTVEYS